jgi:AAA+ superfamily predicted ATPase
MSSTKNEDSKSPQELLTNLIKADVKVIQIVSYETLMIHAILIGAAKTLKRDLFVWSRVNGIIKWDFEKGKFEKCKEHAESTVFEAVYAAFFLENTKDKFILLAEDLHPDFDAPVNIKRIRTIAFNNPATPNKTLVLSQPFHRLPKELEKEVHVLELPYPTANDIETIYEEVHKKNSAKKVPDAPPELINAALGLTIMEAERAFSLAYVESGQLTKKEVPLVIREKENVIRKSGYLEYYHPKEKLEDVGGLDNLKDWLTKRGRGFDKGASDFGLNPPRGILLLGIPGTGKSLIAKAVGNLWKFPLLRLDMGKIFGGFVGESECNIRGALKIAEAIAPSILWIDEIEKGLSGLASSGRSDGGTTARVLGTFLTWMQEKSRPVFVVATANNIAQLPPELLRKGRVDEIFFVDLPNEAEREKIFEIHLRLKNRDPRNFDISEHAKVSKGFSGAEIEEVIQDALFRAYDRGNGSEVSDDDINDAIEKTFPLSQTMRETIDTMRRWAKSRTVLASSAEPEELAECKGDGPPKLKQEVYSNPFVSVGK